MFRGQYTWRRGEEEDGFDSQDVKAGRDLNTYASQALH